MEKYIVYFWMIVLLACNSRQKETSSIAVLPSFKIMLLDGKTILNMEETPSGKPFLLLYFRPDCPHCKQETKDLIKNIDTLGKTRIYLIGNASEEEIKAYYDHYQLKDYTNIVVGKDYNNSFFQAFKPTSIPYMAIYSGEKRLIKIYKGEPDINSILQAVNG